MGRAVPASDGTRTDGAALRIALKALLHGRWIINERMIAGRIAIEWLQVGVECEISQVDRAALKPQIAFMNHVAANSDSSRYRKGLP
jgi:hypothetical protein